MGANPEQGPPSTGERGRGWMRVGAYRTAGMAARSANETRDAASRLNFRYKRTHFYCKCVPNIEEDILKK